MEEWISTKEPHVVYGLPEGTYTLHEELPPYAEGYVSAEDIEFEVKEDGSVTKVEMKDAYSKWKSPPNLSARSVKKKSPGKSANSWTSLFPKPVILSLPQAFEKNMTTRQTDSIDSCTTTASK